MASTLPKLPVFEAIAGHDPQSTAVIHSVSGRRFTYGGLLKDVAEARDKLHQAAGDTNMDGERVAFLVENGYDYVVTLLSILGSNSIAVPLSSGFPASELRYILDNSEAFMLLSSAKFEDKAQEVIKEGLEKKPVLDVVEKRQGGEGGSSEHVQLETIQENRAGLMLYTSGTTSRPKGVLLPESVLTAQARSLLQAWDYTSNDHLLHVLPLHHIHGTVNALITPLFAGSTIEFMFPFNVTAVWERLAAPFLPESQRQKDPKIKIITFLTVVPTIYNRLLATHASLPSPTQAASKEAITPANLRLNISGSAALPTPTKAAWATLSSGNVLLERYGMTEVGMALSCGLSTADRIDGSVGWPLPSVEARLVDTETRQVIPPPGGEKHTESADHREREGEIQLRGPTIFQEYWRNPQATASEFVDGDDGKGKWFKTGDVATRRVVEGAGRSGQEWARGPMWFIRGRKSVDIIKTGGEKVSALEIERELLSLPQISECAVVGLPSEQWGQKVAAVVVLHPEQAQSGRGGKTWGVMDMRRALRERLAPYKIPQEMKVVQELPRNAMVNKKSLVVEVWGEGKGA
ncbi:amp-binding enzyme [Lasallia pustulata]|uniref:Amp-binding enzyme n=1 Tax=Lasallia pustulata TaxID=136370 RepID=A0A1W5CVE2_9LECA|nr:amp-binding enzyme [Lasallia pustulata]